MIYWIEMSLGVNLLILIVSSLVLIRATTLIISSLGKIARFFSLREFSVAFILMAVVTSLPELFVGISSAFQGSPQLSLGNALGSNLVNLTFVTGVVVLASRQIHARSIIVRRDALIMTIFAIIPLVMLLDSKISRVEGFLLLLFYLLYLVRLMGQRSSFRERSNSVTVKQAVLNFFIFLISVVFLLGASMFLVSSAEKIAEGLGLTMGLVGVIFISLGTSLPEIVFELKAVRKNHSGLALGDLVGSVVANSTLVLGVTACICPIVVSSIDVFIVPIVYLLLVLGIFEIFVMTEKKLVVWEGIFLVLFYILFLISELSLGYYHAGGF